MKRIAVVLLALWCAASHPAAQTVGVLGTTVPLGGQSSGGGGGGGGGGGDAPLIPSSPLPANSGGAFSSSTTVSCGGGGGATGWTIYGPDTTNPPTTQHSLGDCSYSAGTLTDGLTYYWKAVASNTAGSTTGPVWSFARISPYPWSNFVSTRGAYACSSNPAIYRVTSLANSGAGTLREALEANEPRIVVFERSGYITLSADVTISSPCITIAGQTAPSPGITVRMVAGNSEAMIFVNAHDVILQHFAVRPGNETCNSAFQVYGAVTDRDKIIFDHMSVTWMQDEAIAWAGVAPGHASVNGVMWRTLIAEALNDVLPEETGPCTGGGATAGHGPTWGNGNNISMVQSVIAKNAERNPYITAGAHSILLNNIVYDWSGPWGYFHNNNLNGEGVNIPWHTTAIGNRSILGLDNLFEDAYVFLYSTNTFGDFPNNQIYRLDNTFVNTVGASVIPEGNQYSYNPNVGSPPSGAVPPASYTILPSTGVQDYILPNVGSRPADRSSIDTRILADVVNHTGHWIHNQNDVGGYPTLAVNTRAYTTPTNPHAVQASGFTNLEQDLAIFAHGVEGSAVQGGGGGGGGGTVSNSGTRVPTNSASIIDNNGDTWSLGSGSGSNIQIMLNGSQLITSGGDAVFGSQVLWLSNQIYVKGDDDNWYLWTGSGFSFLGPTDPEGT